MIYDINGNEAISKYEWKGNYVIGSDFLKRKVYAKKVGVAQYSQSFCKYNDFWYSARETGVIAKQDANFNVVATNDNIVVGHANALQIGIRNVAYSSGWDDDKIHCINLDTLTKDDEIVLPTHGYSTCAVDDYRKLVYIFNRTSYPDTAEHYDFVVYDYENESTLFTAKTTPMFGVMQAVDLYNDHIIVVCDLQRDNVLNETVIRTFDLTGHMVSEISLSEFNGVESEGVFLDRETGDLYVGFGFLDSNESTYKQNIYLLSTY